MSVKNTAIHVGINFGHDCSLSIFRDGIHLKTKMAEREDSVKQSSHLSLTEISSLSSYLERYAGNNIVFGITNTQGNSFQFVNSKVFNFEYLQNQSEHFVHKSKVFEVPWKYHWSKSDKLTNIPWIHHNIIKPRNNCINYPLALNREKIKESLLLPIKVNISGRSYEGYCVDHHLAHLYSGSAICTDDKFVVVSIDGAGSRPINTLPLTYAGLLGVFENRSLVSIETIHFGGGLLYSIGAKLARMSEGKLMGLAPYIDNKNIKLSGLNQAVDFLENQFFTKESIIKVLEGLYKANGNKLRIRDMIDEEQRQVPDHKSVVTAYLTQALYEECHSRLLQKVLHMYPNLPIIFTGGCTLNCPANTNAVIKFEKIMFDPCCNDEGLSTGSALAVNDLISQTSKSSLQETALDPRRGSTISDKMTTEEILLHYPNLEVYDLKKIDYLSHIYQLLLDNKVGAFALGRYEIGPRALCNRSIIARADVHGNHFTINRIKSREPWRPLAPVTKQEYFSQYFEGPMNDFMLTFAHVKSLSLPAISHVDNTARVQIIREEEHPVYHLLTKIYEKNELPPVLINTSLNGHNQPIINSFIDLLGFLDTSELSYILTDDLLIVK